MLKKIFSSRSRVEILKLFFKSIDGKEYFVREISRLTNTALNSVVKELLNLHEIGILSRRIDGNKSYYSLNMDHEKLESLRELMK